MNKRLKSIQFSEDGFVSIIVTMILIIVITIIIIGFAQYSRREQRQALDRQLSTQAFYAAESGVNDARKAVLDGYNGAAGDGKKTSCAPDAIGPLSGTINQIDGTNIQYTCLLINPYPPDLQFSGVSTTSPTMVDFKGSDASGNPKNIKKLKISWQATDDSKVFDDGSTNFYPKFPSVSSWVNNSNAITGMLRVSVVPIIDSFLDYNRGWLDGSNYTAYLYPHATAPGTGTTIYGGVQSNTGDIVDGHCNSANTPSYCNVELDFGGLLIPHYFLRLNAIYHDVKVIIAAYDGAGNPLNISGGQVSVDSTGLANGVLRRIQVRLANRPGGTYPNFGVQSVSGICKQLQVAPGYGQTSPSCVYP